MSGSLLSATHKSKLSAVARDIIECCLPIMAHSASGVPAYETLHALYNDICASVYEDFSDMARVRNTKLAVATLPGELLRQIASYMPTPALDEMTQTCHQWRQQLIGYSHLWRHTAVSVGYSEYRQPTQLRLQLDRVSNAPRSISLKSWTSITNSDDENAARIPELLRAPIFQVTYLSMEMYAWAETGWVDVLRMPAPTLVRFRARFDTEGSFSLPPDLFADDAPNLKEVLLDNIGLPGAECKALRDIKTLRCFGIQLLKGEELGRIFARCSNLENLTIDAGSGESSINLNNVPQLPHLKSLRILSFVWPGALDDLVAEMRSRKGTQVYLGWPRPVHVEEVISQLGRPSWQRLVIKWSIIPSTFRMGPTTPKLEAISYADGSNSALGAMFIEPDRLVRQLRAAGPRLARARELTVPDDIWLQLFDDALTRPSFTNLRTLTVHLSPANPPSPPSPPTSRYTHLFVLQSPTLGAVAPRLEEVHLVRDPTRAFPRCTSVDAVGAHLAQWLPRGVRKLVLRGVRIIEPGAALVRLSVRELVIDPHDVAVAESKDARLEAERWAWSYPFREIGMP
ncbi:hypothetical protein BKA62DRAFT_682455 [Auriculariales sp. MPI-PUGE-AT-0066]|nr:hypothetical protein BKA62DRAFT_682455 [Auriculariales sp. MPI-PUGE-AT-0066]